MTPHLRAPDLILVAVYLIGITLFGLRFRQKKTPGTSKQDSSLRSYFLANNTIPWWAISLSIVSAETSTLTIISIPGVAFAGDFGFLQIVIGYMIGRIVVAIIFLPRYFSGNMLTAYQLIGQRFGPTLHRVTAGLFLLTRAAAEGVRVFAVSIVVGIAIGTRDVLSIAIISILTLLYTFEGGLAAVIWTDVVQMVIYIGGTVVAIATLGTHVHGGWSTIHTVASAAGKFHMLNFALNLTTTYTFWAGILGGTFLTMASHGTDQLMVQRMLAARNLRESRLALLSSGVVIFIQFTLFLLIGAGLYVFAQSPGTPGPASGTWVHGLSPDRIFPTFIVREMPLGVAGLLVAAILAAAMSNLSAALNSLSSTTVVDFYLHLRQPRPRTTLGAPSSPTASSSAKVGIGEADHPTELHPTEPPISTVSDRERNLVAKTSTILWAIVLFAIAVYSLHAGGKGHVVEIGLSIASVAYGCLLGVFLLGTLTKFATQAGATFGMLCGFLLNLYLWQGVFPVHLGPITIPHIVWTWYVLIGAFVTFAIGSLASLIFRKQSKRTRTVTAPLLLLFLLSFPKGICVSAHAQTPVISTGASRLHAMRSGETPVFRSSLQDTVILSEGAGPHPAPSPKDPQNPPPATTAKALSAPETPTTPDFTPISNLLTDAIAAHHLPGAVVLIGHNNRIVFEQAYGDRKLANEPGLTGNPSPAEPMTEDTLFDMASLSKCLSTSTAIMQLYEAGKIASLDDPLAKYLPEFLTADPDGAHTLTPATSPSANAPSQSTTTTITSSPGTNATSQSTTSSITTASSANGATSYQPGATPQVSAQKEIQRAEGPNHSPATFDRSRVTLRMLLTHTSGEAPDVDLRDPWGLAAPDKPEGIHRALTTPLKATPGSIFEYSDINYILLGDLVETLSGQPLDVYAQTHIFQPLGMTETRYLPIAKACGPHRVVGSAIAWEPLPAHTRILTKCPSGDWSTSILPRIAPEAHDNEGTAATNPDFDHLLRGTVHDPTTRRMGGVAGHAGVFSTAHDISLFAQALLDKLTKNTGPFPLKQSTLQLMTQPEQPGHTPNQIQNANAAEQSAIHNSSGIPNELGAPGPDSGTRVSTVAPGLAPHYPAIKSQNLRGFGWDIDTAFSKPRGLIFPIGSFGHTGFTGTSLWMDPVSNTYVILLANAIHPRGNPPISNLRGQIATAAAEALSLYSPTNPIAAGCNQPNACDPPKIQNTLTGIDVLESTHFTALAHFHHIGLLTNQTGIDAQGHRTIDILHQHFLTTNDQQLTTLFSPEHGIFGAQDTEHLNAETDPATHLPVISLYGPHDADKRPSHNQLKDLDAVVIDLQDAGVHFWTYESVLGYFLEAAATERTAFHHTLTIIVLDRPNPVGGLATQGPFVDPDKTSYVAYMPLPVRSGLTFGELARYIVATKHLDTPLIVVPMQHWQRSEFWTDTGLPWINPSPNLRSPEAAILYPGIGLIETTNISVGRGTTHPFTFFGAGIPPQKPGTPSTGKSGSQNPGAPGPDSGTRVSTEPWFNAQDVADALTARHIPGVTFTPTTETIADDANHYPFHGQTIPAVHVTCTDPNLLDTPELGIEILSVLHRLYPTQFQLEKSMTNVTNRATVDAIARGDDPRSIAATWTPALDTFRDATASYRLYP